MKSATASINLIKRDVYTLTRQKIDRHDIAELQANLLEFFPDDQFLKKLVKGVMRVARDKKNPIRGNLVASGLCAERKSSFLDILELATPVALGTPQEPISYLSGESQRV
mgnify:CR=1 FL=1